MRSPIERRKRTIVNRLERLLCGVNTDNAIKSIFPEGSNLPDIMDYHIISDPRRILHSDDIGGYAIIDRYISPEERWSDKMSTNLFSCISIEFSKKYVIILEFKNYIGDDFIHKILTADDPRTLYEISTNNIR